MSGVATLDRPWVLARPGRSATSFLVFVPARSCVIGRVTRHTVEPCERAAWGAQRPRGGDWLAVDDRGDVTICRTRAEAAQAVYDAWQADPIAHEEGQPQP